jgi:phage-related protein
MADLDSLNIKLNADSSKAEEGIDKLIGSLDKIASTLSKATKGADGFANGTKKFGEGASSAAKKLQGLYDIAHKVGSIKITFGSTKQAESAIDSLTRRLIENGKKIEQYGVLGVDKNSDTYLKALAERVELTDKLTQAQKALGQVKVQENTTAEQKLQDMLELARQLGSEKLTFGSTKEAERAIDRLNSRLASTEKNLSQMDALGIDKTSDRYTKALAERVEITEKLKQAQQGLSDVKMSDAATALKEGLSKKIQWDIEIANSDNLDKLYDRLATEIGRVEELQQGWSDAAQQGFAGAQEEAEKYGKELEELYRKLQDVTQAQSMRQNDLGAGPLGDSEDGGSIEKMGDVLKRISSSMAEMGGRRFSSFFDSLSRIPGLADASAGSLAGFAATLAKIAPYVAAAATAFGVLIAAFKLVKGYIDHINKSFDSIVQTLKSLASNIASLMSTVTGRIREGMTGISTAMSSAISKVSQFGKAIQSLVSKLGSKLSSAFDGPAKKLEAFSKSFSRLLTMAAISLWYRGISDVFNNMGEATDLLVDHSRAAGTEFSKAMDMFSTASSYASRSVVAAIEPLINAIMPLLDALIDKIVEVLNFFNQLFSFLGGATTWTRAVKVPVSYETAWDKATKAAKGYQNTVLKFDELNKLNENKGAKNPYGGGLTGETAYEEMELPDWLKDGTSITEVFDHISEAVGKAIKAIKDFLRDIDWDDVYDKAYELGKNIMRILNQIFGDKELAGLLGEALGNVINTAFKFALGMVDEWDPEAWAKSLTFFFKKAFEAIRWDWIREFAEKFGKKLALYFNTILRDFTFWDELGAFFANGFNAFALYVDSLISDFDWEALGVAFGKAFEGLFRNLDWATTFHAFETGFLGLFKSIKQFFGTIDLESDINRFAIALTSALEDFNSNFRTVKAAVIETATEFANGINALLGNEALWSQIATTLSNGINSIILAISTFVDDFDALDVGNSLGNALNEFLTNLDISEALVTAAEIPQKILLSIASGFTNINGVQIGTNLANAINKAVDSIDIGQLESSISTIATKLGETLSTFLSKVDYEDLAHTLAGVLESAIEGVANFMGQFDWDDLGTKLGEAINTFAEDFFVGDSGNNISSILESIITFIQSLIDTIDWAELKDDLDAFMDELPLDDMFATLTEVAGRFWELKKEVVTNWILDKISGTIEGAFNLLGDWISEHLSIDGIIDAIAAALNFGPAWDAIKDLFDFDSLGQDIMDGFFGGIISAIVDPIGFIKEYIVDPILKGFTDGFDIHSPSKITEGFGKDVMQGFIDGLSALIDAVLTPITEVVESITGAFTDVVDSAGSFATDIIDSLSGGVVDTINALGEAFTDLGDSVATVVESISDGIGTIVESIGGAISDVLESLADVIKSIGDAALNAGTGFNNLADGVVKIVDTDWVDLGSSLTTVASGIGEIVDACDGIEDTVDYVEVLGDSFEKIANATGASSVLYSLSGAIDRFKTTADTLSDTCDNIDDFRKAFVDLAGNISSMQSVTTALDDMADSIERIADAIGALTGSSTVFEDLTGFIDDLTESLSNLASSEIAGQIETQLSDFAATLKDTLDSVVTAAEEAGATIEQGVTDFFASVTTTLTDSMTEIVQTVEDDFSSMVETTESSYESIVQTTEDSWNTIYEKISKAMEDSYKAVSDTVNKMRELFSNANLKLDLKLPQPYLKNAGTQPYGIGGKGKMPEFDIEWFAKGGIVDKAQLIGAGEAGAEAILPLENNTEWMDTLADRIADASSNTIPIYIGDELLDTVIAKSEKRRNLRSGGR